MFVAVSLAHKPQAQRVKIEHKYQHMHQHSAPTTSDRDHQIDDLSSPLVQVKFIILIVNWSTAALHCEAHFALVQCKNKNRPPVALPSSEAKKWPEPPCTTPPRSRVKKLLKKIFFNS